MSTARELRMVNERRRIRNGVAEERRKSPMCVVEGSGRMGEYVVWELR